MLSRRAGTHRNPAKVCSKPEADARRACRRGNAAIGAQERLAPCPELVLVMKVWIWDYTLQDLPELEHLEDAGLVSAREALPDPGDT